MYCANYDYHGIYEPIIFTPLHISNEKMCNNKYSQYECMICLEFTKSIIENNKTIIDYPILLQKSIYVKQCECNISIHVSCLDTWYNLQHNCPICKKYMYKNYPYCNLLHKIVMCKTCILFGIIYSIICILKIIRLLLFIIIWYNIYFTIKFILLLPFTYSNI